MARKVKATVRRPATTGTADTSTRETPGLRRDDRPKRRFLPAQQGPGTLALMAEIDRRRVADSTLSYGDAFVQIAAACPDLAALYLVESRGAKPLPGRPADHHPDLWAEVGRLYAALSDVVRADTVPPLVVRHWFMRDQPVYYVGDRGEIIGGAGDRLLARSQGRPDLRPRYASALLIPVALNLAWSSREIQRAIAAILQTRPADVSGTRQRYSREAIAAIIRWYSGA